MPARSDGGSVRQLMTFTVGGDLYGIPIEEILEVLPDRPLTPVPLAPDTIAGLINLRGQIVTAVDLRQRLKLDPMAGDDLPMNVVIQERDEMVSLLVDSIGDVVEVDGKAFEKPPGTLTGPVRDLIRGAYKLDDRLLLLLDSEEILNIQRESASC